MKTVYPPDSKRRAPLHAGELLRLARHPKKLPYLIEALIPENTICLINAPSGNGKTWAALDLARVLAEPGHNKLWLGKFAVKTIDPIGVLYLDEENGEATISERLDMLGLTKDAKLWVWSYQNFRLENLPEIRRFCTDNRIRVVIFDLMIRFHQSNENDAKDMAFVAGAFKSLVKKHDEYGDGLNVVILHHDRKSPNARFGGSTSAPEQDQTRGSGDITAAVDTSLGIKQMPGSANCYLLSVRKLRQASRDKFQSYEYELVQEKVGMPPHETIRIQPVSEERKLERQKKTNKEVEDYVLRAVKELARSSAKMDDIKKERTISVKGPQVAVQSWPQSNV